MNLDEILETSYHSSPQGEGTGTRPSSKVCFWYSQVATPKEVAWHFRCHIHLSCCPVDPGPDPHGFLRALKVGMADHWFAFQQEGKEEISAWW